MSSALIKKNLVTVASKAWQELTGPRCATLAAAMMTLAQGEAPAQTNEQISVGKDPGTMIRVEGGSFLMGDVFGDRAPLRGVTELPVHEVVLNTFVIGKYEVTVGEFKEFVKATGYRTSAEKHEGAYSQSPEESHWRLLTFKQADNEPVLQMSWNDAIHYCNWLSCKHGFPPAYDEKSGALLDDAGKVTADVRKTRGFRLPTEAEWEFAARERGEKVRFGNGQNIARSEEINFDASEGRFSYLEEGPHRKRSTPVGSFKPNALGLHDMSGNAWEWCYDLAKDYEPGKKENPCVSGDEPRILRGGSMGGNAGSVRVSSRACLGRADHCGNSGFRVARTIESP